MRRSTSTPSLSLNRYTSGQGNARPTICRLIILIPGFIPILIITVTPGGTTLMTTILCLCGHPLHELSRLQGHPHRINAWRDSFKISRESERTTSWSSLSSKTRISRKGRDCVYKQRITRCAPSRVTLALIYLDVPTRQTPSIASSKAFILKLLLRTLNYSCNSPHLTVSLFGVKFYLRGYEDIFLGKGG